jgi:Mycoplasma protein of unknown function, DUF285
MVRFSKPSVVAAVVGILLPGMVFGRQCFEFSYELREAVRSYLRGSPQKKFQTKIRYGRKIGDWCLGNVTSLASLFSISRFNEDIRRWDVSRVKYMSDLFYRSRFNRDISKWNVSAVEDMSCMFWGNTAFNRDISNWNVAAGKDTSSMFMLSEFRGDISKWDVSAVKDMSYMFDSSLFNRTRDRAFPKPRYRRFSVGLSGCMS